MIDDIFLKGRYMGILLLAYSVDPNGEMFLIAFAVVDKEFKDLWS